MFITVSIRYSMNESKQEGKVTSPMDATLKVLIIQFYTVGLMNYLSTISSKQMV